MTLLTLLRGGGGSTPSVPGSVPTIPVREPDDRLALSITSPDGQVTRWAGDEINGSYVPTDLTFSTAVPGGFRDLSCSLLRGLNPGPDEGLFRDVRAYGPGNQTAWEGRMAQLPRTNTAVRPGAVGWSAHLEDDKSFREIYVDRDLSRWQPPGVSRRITLVNASIDYEDPSVVPDRTAAPAIATALHDAWPRFRQCGAWYDSGGIPIAKIYYAWKIGGGVTPTDANWNWGVVATDNDATATTSDSTGNLRATGPGTGLLTTTASDRRYAFVYLSNIAAGGSSGVECVIYWTAAAVYGQHGLALQGAGSATDPAGLLGTAIVANAVQRAAPLLNVTTGPDGSIQTDSYALTQCVQDEPGAVSDLIARINAYYSWEWAVWDDRTFFFRPAQARTVWVAKTYEGADLGLEGDQAEDVYNGVVVSFTDPIGRRRIVGPPGVYADSTNAALVDTDPLNPVNLAGIPRRYAKLELSVITDDIGAARIGSIFLLEQKTAKRRGDITVYGSQEQQGRSGRFPAWMIRAGDYLTVGDQIGSPLRRIIQTNYTHSNRSMQLTLDSTGQKLDAILERLQAMLVGVLT